MIEKKIKIDYGQLEALKKSISDWKVKASTGEDDFRCSLCSLGIERNAEASACINCPIEKFVGKKHCLGTPFKEFDEAETQIEAKRAAKKMVNFLERILKNSEVVVDLRYDLEQQKALKEAIKLWVKRRKNPEYTFDCPLCILSRARRSNDDDCCFQCIIKEKAGGCSKTPFSDWHSRIMADLDTDELKNDSRVLKAIEKEIKLLKSLLPKGKTNGKEKNHN